VSNGLIKERDVMLLGQYRHKGESGMTSVVFSDIDPTVGPPFFKYHSLLFVARYVPHSCTRISLLNWRVFLETLVSIYLH